MALQAHRADQNGAPLLEVVTRPGNYELHHDGGVQRSDEIEKPNTATQHVQCASNTNTGKCCELEKRKSAVTPEPHPAEAPTPGASNPKSKQPRSKSCVDVNLTIVTQNIRGNQGTLDPDGNIHDLGDIEAIVELMIQQNIDIYLLQETWIYEDFETNIQGITIINHGTERGRRNKGGVAILLNHRAEKAWNNACCPEPNKYGKIAGDNTRIMTYKLLFQPRRKQSTKFIIGTIYAPQSGITAKQPELLQEFHNELSRSIQEHFDKDTRIILGGDWNALISLRNGPETMNILGEQGIKHVNKAGKKIIELARNHEL